MDTYTLKLCGLERKLPIIELDGETAIASFVILGDTELVSTCAPVLARKIGDVDQIVTAEAKGIILAHEVSKCLGHKEFIVARKSIKSYMKDIISVSVHSITTQEPQELFFDGVDQAKISEKSVCIIDDVISSGESLYAMEKLVEKAGGYVKKKVALLAEGAAIGRKDITVLENLPTFSKE